MRAKAAVQVQKRSGRGRVPHVALIMEDNPEIAAGIAEGVRARGDTPWIVTNLEELRAAIDKGGFCYVLLDIEVPARPGGIPHPRCGETAIEWLRAYDSARTKDGRHVLPIIVISGFNRSASFASDLLMNDANAFVEKPFSPDHREILERIDILLAKAERTDHEACASPRAPRGKHREERRPRRLRCAGTIWSSRFSSRAR